MANGFCPALLSHVEAITGTNPAKKLRPLGFTRAVLDGMDPSIQANLTQQYDNGHERAISVRYRTRPLTSQVATALASCDVAFTPSYAEFNLPALLTRQISFYMPDSLIRQYCIDASKNIKLSGNNNDAVMESDTPLMQEVYELFIEYGGALLRSINAALVNQQATQFGVNVNTGTNNAKAIAFSLQTNAMQDAFVQLMADLRDNEVCNDIILVGNGDFANFDLVKAALANGPGVNGINKQALAAELPNVYYDKDTTSLWGVNNIGAFEKGSVGLVTRNRYVGSFARELANSQLFSLSLPVDEYYCPQQGLDRLMFDVQYREIDCPTTLNVNGANTTVSEGVQITLQWNGSLFVKPGTLYDPADDLYGTNGTLRYAITGN